MSDLAIDVRNVWKTFRLYDDPITGPIKSLLMPWRRDHYSKPFHAVRDASLQIRRGEVVGIVGANGAGKSTLLKAIAGLLPIDRGEIKVNGKLTALLALGIGINHEFSGRDNIVLNGLLYGMDRQEITAKLPAIIAFAELGEFIDHPMRTYSSGMRARLLFSVSMAIDTDILIVDEALATGDAYFVAKSSERVREMCRSGLTVLFVSHNVSQIKELCSRAILMGHGEVLEEGTPESIVDAYNKWAFEQETQRAPAGRELLQSGSGQVRLRDVRLLDASGNPSSGFHTGDAMAIEIDYESDLATPVEATLFLGVMRKSDKSWVGEIWSSHYVEPGENVINSRKVRISKNGQLRVEINPLLLLNGHYDFWIMIYNETQVFLDTREIAPFFAARAVHVHDRGPVYCQPARIHSLADSTE